MKKEALSRQVAPLFSPMISGLFSLIITGKDGDLRKKNFPKISIFEMKML